MDEQLIERKKILFERRFRNNIINGSVKYQIPVDGCLREGLWNKFKDTTYCEYCGHELNFYWKSGDQLKDQIYIVSIDHVKPRSKGGYNDLNNLAICCYGCNLLKGAMNLRTFLNLLNVVQRPPYGSPQLLEEWKIEGMTSSLASKLDRDNLINHTREKTIEAMIGKLTSLMKGETDFAKFKYKFKEIYQK